MSSDTFQVFNHEFTVTGVRKVERRTTVREWPREVIVARHDDAIVLTERIADGVPLTGGLLIKFTSAEARHIAALLVAAAEQIEGEVA